jgi:photosystem II stability/assembly factor-like uncharacterized protein
MKMKKSIGSLAVAAVLMWNAGGCVCLPAAAESDAATDGAADITDFYQFEEGTLLSEDFEDGDAGGWKMEEGWSLVRDDGECYMEGRGHRWAVNGDSAAWSDYTFSFDFKLTGECHVCFRVNQSEVGQTRYILALHGDEYQLIKQLGQEYEGLFYLQEGAPQDEWHRMTIDMESNTFKLYLDGELLMNYTDRTNPISAGAIAFECLDDSILCIDNVDVTGVYVTQRADWERTGGPLGGLGYDVRIDPENKAIMFVTDNPSGVNKSVNGGETWTQANAGITTRTGSSSDEIPIFSLTIDPNDPDILWTGTQTARGIFKSLDCGDTWMKMDDGVVEDNEITIRGFAVKPGDSDTVFAAVEIDVGLFGVEFARQKGKIYKTTDGGENWRCVWEGGSLARVVIFDPADPDILYASTGIFDREAYNGTGEGVLKSTDGGETWTNINNGLNNLFVGFLEMHPTDNNTLVCAAGNNIYNNDIGIYITRDGGENWTRILEAETLDPLTVVTYSSSDPNVLYAGSPHAFYRSDDGGVKWKLYTKDTGSYGPPGVSAGFPISAAVDPDDPMVIFVNNYGGGVFKSVDGAATWSVSSTGYTGANLHQIIVSPDDADTVYAVGRSGPYVSADGGESWEGLAYPPLNEPEWDDIAICPSNSLLLLCSDEFYGYMYRSTDGGETWRTVMDMNEHRTGQDDVANRHGFKAIEFAPSSGDVVYAGMRKNRNVIDGNTYLGPSYGMFKSTDGGSTWTEINGGLEDADRNINCIAVHPADENTVYIGTFLDGVFKSTDGGETWLAASNGLMSEDIRSLAIDPDDPDIIYAGLGNGVGLYKSTDGGQNWSATSDGIVVECPSYLQRIGQVNPGVSLEKPSRTVGIDYVSLPWTLITSVVIYPFDTDVIFVSDYQRGVYMTTTGGESWVAINEGLDFKSLTSLALAADGTELYASTAGNGVYRLELDGE